MCVSAGANAAASAAIHGMVPDVPKFFRAGEVKGSKGSYYCLRT